MTTSISSGAAAAREHARATDGRFGTQPLAEADVALAPHPGPYVQLVTLELDMDQAAAAATRRGWTLGAVTWPREVGEENKRTDYTPTATDAAAIRWLLEADEDAPVVVYWAECQWRYEGDDRYSTSTYLVIGAGDDDGYSDDVYESDEGDPTAALTELFGDLDGTIDPQ